MDINRMSSGTRYHRIIDPQTPKAIFLLQVSEESLAQGPYGRFLQPSGTFLGRDNEYLGAVRFLKP
jgi:hypothetical protein